MLPIGIFELDGICSGTCNDGGTLFIGAIALFVAIGLSIDAALRGGRIDARRRAVTFDGALTVRWNG